MADPTQTAVIKLAQEAKSWKSIEIRVRHHLSCNITIEGLNGDFYNLHNLHYIETSRGERLFDITRHSDSGSKNREAGYCDGARCAQVAFGGPDLTSQNEVRITRSFMTEGTFGSTRRPFNLVYLHVGKIPIDEALPGSRSLGSGRVIGRVVDVFLFPQVRWGSKPSDLVYYLDRETATPLMVESYQTEEAHAQGRPVWRWSVQKLEIVQGHPIAMASEFVAYKIDGPVFSRNVAYGTKETVESVEFDRDYLPSTFWPSIQEGKAKVIDSIGGTVKLPPKSVPSPSNSISGQEVRVAPISDWTSTYSAITLGLGLILVVSAFVIWFRRRSN